MAPWAIGSRMRARAFHLAPLLGAAPHWPIAPIHLSHMNILPSWIFLPLELDLPTSTFPKYPLL
jgi:hypothetical protein